MYELLWVAKWRWKTCVAVHDGLDLNNEPVLDLQSHRVVRRHAVFLDSAEPGRVASIRVRDLEAGFCHAADRAPQAYPTGNSTSFSVKRTWLARRARPGSLCASASM